MLLSWHYINRAAYDAADVATKTSDKLYFISDTHEIYRGTENFTESVILYTTEPQSKAVGKLYINSTTLEGKIWNGTSWTTVIQPVQAAIVTGDTSKPVSSKAVETYVAAEIAKVTGSSDLVKSLSYAAATNKITVTMTDDTTNDIELTNVAIDLVYDKTTGKLNVKNAAGTTIGTGVSLDLERFVQSASYDPDTHEIELVFNDNQDPVTIDVGDLVDTYTAKSSKTVKLTVTNNEFTAEAIVAETSGNILKATDSGLFVAATDISGKQDKLTGEAKAIVGFDGTGNLSTSYWSVDDTDSPAQGNAANAATTLATIKAVRAITDALATTVGNKMDKVGTGHNGELITADTNGNATASGVKAGGAAFKSTTDGVTLATEKGVETYVTGYAVAKTAVVADGSVAADVTGASDAKVPSEKAFVDALTWKTTA